MTERCKDVYILKEPDAAIFVREVKTAINNGYELSSSGFGFAWWAIFIKS